MARWQNFEAVAFHNGISGSVGKFTANTMLLLSYTFYGRPIEQGRPLYFHLVVPFYLLSFFSSPNLSSRRMDVYHIPHMVWP